MQLYHKILEEIEVLKLCEVSYLHGVINFWMEIYRAIQRAPSNKHLKTWNILMFIVHIASYSIKSQTEVYILRKNICISFRIPWIWKILTCSPGHFIKILYFWWRVKILTRILNILTSSMCKLQSAYSTKV